MTWFAIGAAAVAVVGGASANNQVSHGRDDISNLATHDPTNFGGAGGFGIQEEGVGAYNRQQVRLGAGQDANLAQLTAGQQGLFGGGLFNDPNFQNAFQNNDIFGALQNSNNQFNQQAGGSAFGGLGGLFNQSSQLSGGFANQVANGPQDFSGGLQNQLFGQGFANQLAAGDQSALFNQSLASQRAAAQPQQDRLFNRLQDRQFAQGRLGSTGGAQETGSFFDSLGQQDLGFQNNAFGQAQQQQNFLSQLGSSQIGQGQGFLQQSLGQHNQNAQFANLFGQQAQGAEGQQFGQLLQALQQNQSAGQQRLQNAQGLFGQGSDIFNQNIGLGLQTQGSITDINQLMANLFLGQQNAAANRTAATGQHARAIGDSAADSAGLIGGVTDSVAGAVGGFSDIRLKDNVSRIGTIGDFNWYEWDWNDKAKAIGADKQNPYGVLANEVAETRPDLVTLDGTGYLKVNYGEIL